MKIFISQSHDDKSLADALVEFLTNGIGINLNSIFCSSSPDRGVPLGLDFNDYIIKQLQDQEVQVLALITNNYFNSNYSMYELGASWGLCKNTIPILGPRMQYANLGGFLKSRAGVKITNDDDINILTQDLQRKFPDLQHINLPKWIKAKKDFFERIKLVEKERINKRSDNKYSSNLKTNYKYKVVAFDFDGTLLQGASAEQGKIFEYSWKEIWTYLGYDDKKRNDLYNKHRNDPQSYSYQDWCNECAEHFRKEKFKRDDIKNIILKGNLKLADGLTTTLNALRKHGIVTAIISGGINTFYDEVMNDQIKSLFTKVFFNEFEYDQDGYLVKIKAYQNKESDFVGKVNALKEVCKLAKCEIEEAVFVGEGTNDIAVAKSGCLSIAYPSTAKQDFKDIADIQTTDSNLATILGDILIPKSSSTRVNKNMRIKR